MRIAVGGESFEVEVAGPETGPLVLLVHGFPDVPATWAHVTPRLLDAGYRCAAPYLRGYRPSTSSGPFDADQLADDLVEIAEHLAPGRPVLLCGHDWGAVATYVAAMRHPDRLRAVVTLSVPHPLAFLGALARDPRQLARSAYMGLFQVPWIAERAIVERRFIERLWRAWSPSFEPPADHLDRVLDALRADPSGPLGPYRAMTRPPREAIARVRFAKARPIRTPTLQLHGVDDRCIAPSARAGQRRYFDGPFEEALLPGGHFLPLEAPVEVAARTIAWFARYG